MALLRVLTIGHSTRPIDEFIRLLTAHDVERVIDIRTKDQTPAQQAQTLLEPRKISFAAFHRTTKQGFADHIHAVAIGDPGLDPSAARQVEAYKNGRDGLKGNGPLDGPRVKITVFPLTWTRPSMM